MKINVTYMSGAGNLFSVINNEKHKFGPEELSFLAKILCNKNKYNSFKSEGFLAVEKGMADNLVKIKFNNPDGSSGMMCGNGSRCALLYAEKEIINTLPHKQIFKFEMSGLVYLGRIDKDSFSTYFQPPKRMELNKKIVIDGKEITGDYIDVNSDHFVLDPTSVDIDKEDKNALTDFFKAIRYHKDFGSWGTNVNLYEIKDNKIHLTTYERGVEAVTGACGTGTISTAISLVKHNKSTFPVRIIPPSDNILEVNITGTPDNIGSIILTGPAQIFDTKTIEIPDFN